MNRVPAFGEVGIKKAYNGAIAYTPDGNPIIGPAWDLDNFWLSEGHSFGITAAGGAGWQLAEWIVDGEPTVDMLGVEPRRFGDYATKQYLIEKNDELKDLADEHGETPLHEAAMANLTTICHTLLSQGASLSA